MINKAGLFASTGAHVLVDGQFGSTGKGLFAAWLARMAAESGISFAGAVSNAGPNSGHTFYHEGKKHVLKQLPTFAVASSLLGDVIPVYLSAGAVLDIEVLLDEAARYPDIPVFVDPMAAVVGDQDREEERAGTIAAVAGTRSGTGAALARKIRRDPAAVAGSHAMRLRGAPNVFLERTAAAITPLGRPYFVEVSQGFSLGVNSQFYPKVTSRECTVMQAIADARIPAQLVSKVYMTVRTFPIRVGDVDGYSSGGGYPDQEEIEWTKIGVEPELTTVTKRPRRLFTFSDEQFVEAIQANMPDVVFVNFMNYLGDSAKAEFRDRLARLRADHAYKWFDFVYGEGPACEDVKTVAGERAPAFSV